jgi:hypothetical protein
MVIAIIALVVAASGTAVAASRISGDKLIKKRSLSANRLRKFSITRTELNFRKLGKVPTASLADKANTANAANTASNANALGGQPPSAYASSSTVNRSGNVVLGPGGSMTLFSNGQLSLIGSCSSSGGVLTATVDGHSTVGNWLLDDLVQPGAGNGSFTVDNANDSGSPGSPSGDFSSFTMASPGGNALNGQEQVEVNWPSGGKCFFQGFGMS